MSRIVEKIAEEARQEGLIEGEIKGLIAGLIAGEIEGEIKGKTDFLRELIQRLYNLGKSTSEMVSYSGLTEDEVFEVLAEIGCKSMSKIESLQHYDRQRK